MINKPNFSINQKGQVIIILLLIVLVVLSVGLAVTQRANTDVATSTQTDQSARALSAAEAGMEKILSNPSSVPTSSSVPLGNSSNFTITKNSLLPIAASGASIEYPPTGKELTAQFWLADSINAVTALNIPLYYTQNTFDIYFGNITPLASGDSKPAVEVTVLYQETNSIKSQKYYFDSDSSRASTNGFNTFKTPSISSSGFSLVTILSTAATPSLFYAKVTGVPSCNNDPLLPGGICKPLMVRVRILYSTVKQSIALAPAAGGNFPPQVEVYNSLGTSGQSQKRLQVFQIKNVVPPWFDYSIFSVNDIKK